MTRFSNIRLLLSLFLCGSLSLTSVSLFAATLKVSDNLIVSEINDKSVEHGFLGKKSVFELGQGTHAVILRYKDVFEDLDFAEERVVESKEFVAKFTITDEQQLNLTTIEIKNLARARSFSMSPVLKLEDEHDKPLSIKLEKVADYKLAKQVDIAVNSLTSKQAVKKPKEPILTTPTKVATPTETVDIKQQPHHVLIQINSLAMLKYWWQNASNEEKKHFKQYIKLNN